MRASYIIIAAVLITGLATMFVAERSYSNHLNESANLAQPSPQALAMLAVETDQEEITATVPEN